MKKLLLLISLSISTSAMAAGNDCTYQIDSENVDIKWEAFKTPAKVGVGGQFKKVSINSKKKGKSISDIVNSAKIVIDASSVSTKNKGRDLKIAKFFFSTMEGGSKIDVRTVETTRDKILISVTMNGQTRDVPLRYKELKENFEAEGVIDVLDFAMSDELAAITKACEQKHEGKTWSDVNIKISAKFKKMCN